MKTTLLRKMRKNNINLLDLYKQKLSSFKKTPKLCDILKHDLIYVDSVCLIKSRIIAFCIIKSKKIQPSIKSVMGLYYYVDDGKIPSLNVIFTSNCKINIDFPESLNMSGYEAIMYAKNLINP